MTDSNTTTAVQSVDIIQLLENAPLTRLSDTCQHRLMTKMRETFTDKEQQMFLMSFYTYLNYDKHEFVVNLDKVWEWLGFSTKGNASRLLKKYFTEDVDYKLSLTLSGERKVGRGGQNKESIILTIKTFELFSAKARTEKANRVYAYYVKLEDLLQEALCEESEELKKQIDLRNNKAKELRQSMLLQNFPKNTQCVYYGSISNKSTDGETLIKFGNSNDLSTRVSTHMKTYSNFNLIQAFRVENKMQAENAIKSHTILCKYRRTIELSGNNYTELLAVDKISLEEVDKIIKNIIKSVEFTPENYTKLLEENEKLKNNLQCALTKPNASREYNHDISRPIEKCEINNNILSDYANPELTTSFPIVHENNIYSELVHQNKELIYQNRELLDKTNKLTDMLMEQMNVMKTLIEKFIKT